MSETHRTSAWTKISKSMRPIIQAQIDAGHGWCFDGKHVLRPGERWDVSHIMSVQLMKAAGIPEAEWHRPDNLTSSHSKCNRSKGGTAGAQAVNRKRKNEKRELEW